MNQYKLKTIILLCLLCLGVTLVVTRNPQYKTSIISRGSSSRLSSYSISGRFELNNSISSLKLFDYMGHYAIATRFTFSISADINSSSIAQINMTGLSNSYQSKYWEGPNEFTVNPGQLVVQTYISHYCSDTFASLIAFYGQLVTINASASGFFNVTEQDPGIYPQECGTGNLYVSNITEWLNNREMSSSKNLVNSIQISLFLFFVLSIVVIQRRTKK